MITIKYKLWEFTIDKDENEQTYARYTDEMSKPQTCGCASCLNYLENRDAVFPLEFKHLLASLGVDYQKEAEMYHSHRFTKGFHVYAGWFHARGRFKGPHALPENGQGVMEMHSLNPDFSIGFHYASDLNYFSDNENLIQIEFITTIPWTLDEQSEPE